MPFTERKLMPWWKLWGVRILTLPFVAPVYGFQFILDDYNRREILKGARKELKRQGIKCSVKAFLVGSNAGTRK